jgi:rare lipoprotein A (peptidoglycan hydrolase)
MRKSVTRQTNLIGVAAALVFSLHWVAVPGPALADDFNDADFAAAESNVVFPTEENDLKREAGPGCDTNPVAASIADLDRPRLKVIVGTASFYDYPSDTASGEPYDPDAFTAAVQLSIRNKFGGIRYGRKYQPAYGIAEYGGKKLVLKFNDVGPLRRGRKFDLSRAAMAYFGGLEIGLLARVRVTRLPVGQTYPTGPLEDQTCLRAASSTTPAT